MMLVLSLHLLISENPCESGGINYLRRKGRSVTHTGATQQCDYRTLRDKWKSWHKVTGSAGNALAAVDVPAEGTCGTKVRLYLNESHPTPGDGQVTRQVCSATTENICDKKVDIDVINCGAFYLYKLVEFSPSCEPAWQYCTNGKNGEYC